MATLRYNSRDSPWWMLQNIQDYVNTAPDGLSILSEPIKRRFPKDVENLHMGYAEETRIDGTREVTFLYKLAQGMATESFGVECARLARVPERILEAASEKAEDMRILIEKRTRRNRYAHR